MDHNHLKKERGTWPVSILPALQSIDSNGNQSHLCCKLLYMCSTLLDVNNSGHTTTQSGIGNFMCCHFVPRTSEPLETRLMNREYICSVPVAHRHENGHQESATLSSWLLVWRTDPVLWARAFFFALDHTWPHCQERHYTQEAAFWHAFRLHLIHCVLIISALEMILWIGWGFRASFLCYESIRKLASASWIPLCLSKESPMWIFTVNYPPLPPLRSSFVVLPWLNPPWDIVAMLSQSTSSASSDLLSILYLPVPDTALFHHIFLLLPWPSQLAFVPYPLASISVQQKDHMEMRGILTETTMDASRSRTQVLPTGRQFGCWEPSDNCPNQICVWHNDLQYNYLKFFPWRPWQGAEWSS